MMGKQNNKTYDKSKSKDKNFDKSKDIKDNKDKRPDTRKPGNSKKEQSDGTRNDFSWWFKDPDLAASVLSLPNTGITGIPINYGNDIEITTPGILALHTVHGISPTQPGQPMNAVNVAATQLFQDITRRNSRPPTTYNKQDLMIYYLAVNEANAFITYCMRAYGAMMYWRFRNKYVPIKLFEAMGLDWNTFRTHEMEFYSFMKEFIDMASSLPVPRAFDFYQRSGYIYSGYYSDGSSTKAQIYMNVPALWRVYQIGPQGGYLHTIKWATGRDNEKYSLSDLKTMGWKILEPLITDEDIAVIGSDILRAYGAENCFSWNPPPIDYVTEPIPDNYNYLTQVHNADIGMFVDFENDHDERDSFDITGNPDDLGIEYVPYVTIGSSETQATGQIWNNTTKLIDVKGDSITPEDWFYGTMWKNTATAVESEGVAAIYFNTQSARTEIIVGVTVFCGDERIKLWQNMGITDSNYADRYGRIAYLQQFDWHPLVNTYGLAPDESLGWVQPFIELENYSDIPKSNIENINRAAMYGIWGLSDRHINASKA